MNLRKTPPAQITKPETFILESLSQDDEEKNRLDGKVLYDVLRLQGKNPIYYYFRTQTELIKFSDIFRDSGYRYLHLSCHGDEEKLEFTFGQCNYQGFSSIFEKKLNNRRLFISGCSLGNTTFAEELFKQNGGMYSLTAPINSVFFDQTTSFWPAFYYMMHAYDSEAMRKERLQHVLTKLTEIFEMPLAHYFKSTAKGGAIDEQVFSGVYKKEKSLPSKAALPGEGA